MTPIEKAIEIALNAHKNQKDKGGAPYIFHPLRLMLQMKTEEEMIVAVLHDVVEDSNTTLQDLLVFSTKIMAAVDALTHRKDESYDQYLVRVKNNHLAIKVKEADIQDNLRIDRIKNPTTKDFARIEKYKNAAQFLGSKGGKKSVKSRFKGKTKSEISAIMKAVRQSNLIK